MAEAKNSFLKAKMNQDLDDRLLPNGEYRTAQNVLVGKSEEDSVGTLQNIKGNTIVSGTQLGVGAYGQIEIIGYYMDPTSNRIITFTTDWSGSAVAPADASCAVRSYNLNNGSYNVLVEGSFLNFSQNNTIIAVNLLEDLLFWTDNRNQPRKINIETALREGVSHYYKENHISVSKYNPYQAILLINKQEESVISVTSETEIEVAENANITVGMTVLAYRNGVEILFPYDYVTVTAVEPSSVAGQIIITTTQPPAAFLGYEVGDEVCFLISTMTDKAEDPTWPGDPDYLENKFVRFAYRFKFEDNEYSIYSPFTQIAFIPKQKGYFINGDENKAIGSTILDWFENNVNNIELIIPLPDKGINIANSYKISEIDILYKESDSLAVKVLDTVNVSVINNEENYYSYSYQSRKPIRTLPEEQTIRVFDKVPSKAFSQEIISNRVVYGNFLTKPSPPSSISYTVNFQPKIASCDYPSFIEYPNHNIKQNRNYQVGFVLSDKFGRQSSVILSPVLSRTIGTADFGGSTIYAEYMSDDPVGSGDIDPGFMPQGVKDWFGNSLVVQINDPINGGSTGLYATPSEDGSGFALDNSQPVTITDTEYIFTLDTTATENTAIPKENEYLRGQYIDYVKITNVDASNAPVYTITTESKVNESYKSTPGLPVGLKDIKYAYILNPNGWYSYKMVVKQIEQEYYNVYLPSAFSAAGLVTGSTDTDANVSYVTLINDNINKIPRDLAEVGPDQKQYRSSVKLYGRVAPSFDANTSIYKNKQYFPLRSSDTSTVVGNASDLIGATTAAQQFSAISNTTQTTDTIIVKNLYPGNVIPRGAKINNSSLTSVSPGTYVESCSILGFRYNGAPSEDGVWAEIKLSNTVGAAVGNFINFITEPGAYIFQGETDPILARVSTTKQFGINYNDFALTNANAPEDRFQLSVYETDPFISALDIYWESSESGLISDINEDVAVGYDGPTSLQPPEFELWEDDPIGHILTQTFYPVDQFGVAIPQTSLNSFSVEDGAGNVTQNGALFSINQITSGPDQGAYQIQSAAEFAYLWNSYQNNVYTFSIEVQNTNPSTEWEFQTLTFTGSLKNRPPDFTLPSPPNYVFNNTFGLNTPIADFGLFYNPANPTNPVNGTIDANLKTEDLVWDIEYGNDDGFFEMDPNGFITITLAGSQAPNAVYPVGVRLSDATELNQFQDPGRLSVTKVVNLIKGFEPTNFNNPVQGSESYVNWCQYTSPFEVNTIYYMSDFNYAQLPPNDVFDFLPATLPPNFNVNFQPTTPALKRGEFAFGLENWYAYPYDCNGDGATAHSFVEVEAYKRPIDSSTGIPIGGANAAWTPAPDLNGIVVQNVNYHFIDVYDKAGETAAQGSQGMSSWLAFGDTMHEYAFLVTIKNGSGFTRTSTSGYIRIRDLHYPGPNFTQIPYEFTNGSGDYYYADSPFFQYNLRYFQTSDLIDQVAVNPPGFDGNSLTTYVTKRYTSPTTSVPVMDAQFNWWDFSVGVVMNNPEIWYCRGTGTYDAQNDVDKTGTPPFVVTKKVTTTNNSYPPSPTANWQTRGPNYPGEFPWNRSQRLSGGTGVPTPPGGGFWSQFFPDM
jgi:hypothetical protein